MRFYPVLLACLLLPQILSAQAPTTTWLNIDPLQSSVGEDVTLFASVWAQNETPTGSVEFADRATGLATAPLVPLPAAHGRIASGFSHNCVIAITGSVWCWGNGGSRQLGINALTNHNQPVEVQGLPGPAVMLGLGGSHSCAVLENGQLWCWGANAYGQLGFGDLIQHFVPEQVTAITDPVVHVDGGENHTCAVTQQGDVYCWGRNHYGQLGDGTTILRSSPVLVGGLGRVVSVGAGVTHSCALLRNTRVFCWGRNTYGELGDGTTANSLVPVGVVNGRNATMVVLGLSHSCLLRNNGTVRCWGRNSFGQLGDGTTTDRLTPVRAAAAGRDVVDIDATSTSTCAVRWQGRVRCWGRNPAGELGDGTQIDRPSGATTLLPGQSWAWSVSTYDNGACAQGVSGGVQCWGYNAAGETGDGTFVSPRLSPVPTVGGAIAWPQASAYARHLVPGGWSAGLRRIRASFPGSATLAASVSNRIDHRTLP
jgi:Alpha-tubulin suppressor and related RCC1 domain-containing proteins